MYRVTITRDGAEGRAVCTHRPEVKQLPPRCTAGVAGSAMPPCCSTRDAAARSAEGSAHFTAEQRNTQPQKPSASLRNTPREEKICHRTLCEAADLNRRNIHHSLQPSFTTQRSHHSALPGCPPVASSIFSQCPSLFTVAHLTTPPHLAAARSWTAS